MTRKAHLISAVAVLAIACDRPPGESARSSSSVDGSANAPPAGVAAQGSFAYVDSSGAQMLALDSLPEPSAIVGALCSGGVALPVRYDRQQARRPNDNGRQTAYNFRNDQGDVFRVMRGSAPPDRTCYLSRDPALIANARAVTVREPTDCLPAYVLRVTAAKRREVIHCWHIATTPANRKVLAVQFANVANVDTNALASLAVIGDGSLLFKDFPAVHNAESTWRVDDGGVFSPKDFDILFVAEMPYGYVMAIAWAGAEGESCELLLADSPDAFRALTTGYRYWAPT